MGSSSKVFIASFAFHATLLAALWVVVQPGRDRDSYEMTDYSVSLESGAPKTGQRAETDRTQKKAQGSSAVATAVNTDFASDGHSKGEPQGSSDGLGAQTASLEAAYLSGLARKLDANKAYPRSSLLRRETGEVKVGFTILADGRFENIRVVESSKFASLDDAALSAVKQTERGDAIPAELGKSHWDVVVPIRFELSGL
jgi:TonB family protein